MGRSLVLSALVRIEEVHLSDVDGMNASSASCEKESGRW